MDFTLTHSLLTKYLDTNASPEDIAKCLSLCGPTVDRLLKLDDGDYLYEIEIITNRVDAASAYGIAREAAAILPEFGYQASIRPINLESIVQSLNSCSDPLDVEIVNNPSLNPRVLALKISDVAISNSPEWLSSTLSKLGSRPLNNIIDVTNYVMWELGHPIHAFDYDRLITKKIIVREANKNETFITLDHLTHTCLGGEIIYDDGTGNIIDLPGIMGTNNTVITPETRNVLLWIESNDPKKIRKTSLDHQIRSQAAILNEKGVDTELGYTAILRAAELMIEISHGHISSQLLDLYPAPKATTSLNLDLSWLKLFTGIDLDFNQVVAILSRLGINSTLTNDHNLVCTIPTYRIKDITIQEDLAEEIMRIYGYFRLPSNLPITNLPHIATNTNLKIEQAIKHQLVKQGATEVFNLSLVDNEMLSQTNTSKDQIFSLSNPLSSDHVHMRPSLSPSLMVNLKNNLGKFDDSVFLFELANTYLKDPNSNLAIETPHLAMVWTKTDYRSAKGQVEALLSHLNITFNPQKHTPAPIGINSYIIEISLDDIFSSATTNHKFAKIPEYMPIIEDLTFVIPENQMIGPIIESIKKFHSTIHNVELKAIYRQNYTFTITYLDDSKQLATTDISEIRKGIVNHLNANHDCDLIGSLA